MERDNDRFSPRARLFDQSIRYPLGDLSLLVSRAALEQRDLNDRHEKSSVNSQRDRPRSTAD